MREILFRAYDEGRKEYLSGGNLFIAINNSQYPNKSEIYLDVISNADKYKERFVIEQYTGLTDKNGKKIFEGDICQHRSYYSDNIVISVVTYTDGQFLAMPDKNSGFNLSDKLEVIGNIHDNPDNPELLKGGER